MGVSVRSVAVVTLALSCGFFFREFLQVAKLTNEDHHVEEEEEQHARSFLADTESRNFYQTRRFVQQIPVLDVNLSEILSPLHLFDFYSPGECPPWSTSHPVDRLVMEKPWVTYYRQKYPGLGVTQASFYCPESKRAGHKHDLLVMAISGDSQVHAERRETVFQSWGESEHFYFVTKSRNIPNGSKVLRLPEDAEEGGRFLLGRKMLNLWSLIAKNFSHYNFYLKADDDVYIHRAAFHRTLRYLDSSVPFVLGRKVGLVKAPYSWLQRTALTPHVTSTFQFCHGGAGSSYVSCCVPQDDRISLE